MTATSSSSPGAGRRRPSGLAWRRARWGYVFIAPWIIGFFLFTLIPMVATFIFTFTNIDLANMGNIQFVGLAELRPAADRLTRPTRRYS